jgi:hypothetical protein
MIRSTVLNAGIRRGVLATLWVLWNFAAGGPGTRAAVAADQTMEVRRAVVALAATCVAANEIQQSASNIGLYEAGPYLVGTNLAGGEVRTGIFRFQRHVEYVLVGWGDNDARDVDIIIRDDDNDIVARDVATDANPVVRFTPTQTGNYHVELKLYAPPAGEEFCFCCMMVLQEGGWTVPLSNCEDAIANLAKVAGYVIEHEHDDVTMANGDCWSVAGIVLRNSEVYTSSNLRLETGRHVFIGAGDSHADDLDYRVQSMTGRTLGKDEARDEYPITAFHSGGEPLKTTISLPDSSGASLVLQAMLKVD